MNRPLPPTYFFGSIVLMGILHWLLPLKQLIAWPWRWLGVLPLSAGIAVDLIANAMFKKRGTTVKPFEECTTLSSCDITTSYFKGNRSLWDKHQSDRFLSDRTHCYVSPPTC